MEKMNKQQTIQYLTDLMATIANAHYKGRMMDCSLRVHDSGEAGISIDLYNFSGDGKPVCEGLTFNIDGKNEMQRAFCLVYNPDYEEEHLWIMCFNDKPCNYDDDYELLPEDLPEAVLKNIVTWLEQAMQPVEQEEKKLMLLCSYDEDERDHGALLAVSRERFKNDPDAVRKAIREKFTPCCDEDEQELKECIDDLMQERDGYYGIEYYWKELQVLL